MASITVLTRKQYSGPDADKSGVTGAAGETYTATDTGLRYTWDPNAGNWISGGGIKGWELVYNNLLLGPTDSFVITTWDNGHSVNGDIDDIYKFIFYHKTALVGGSSIWIRPNSDAGVNYPYLYTLKNVAGFSHGQGTDNEWRVVHATAQNDIGFVEGIIYAKSGNARVCNFEYIRTVNIAANMVSLRRHSGWANTGDNIASLQIVSNPANGMAAGTHLMILRKQV